MSSDGSQRKRSGRMGKSANTYEKGPSQNNDHINVSAAHITPTLEESVSATGTPAAECRRSSRKKIIKFDVRDLLNKNRKTHKIQIEARIDSNAPTTSKAATTCGAAVINSKTKSTREDLLSKQKTFLEKSAIFRRYSISQEHKPPPPPLPIPPLLGKTNNKELDLSSTNARRLNSTQEFFSNVMIKPKQTTSLIVAQIESNTPCSVATTKRKTPIKSIETKVLTKPEAQISSGAQQKKRGRPSKNKMHTSVEISEHGDSSKKQMTPEKAKNWKEYKACLAQQSDSSNEGKLSFNIKDKAALPNLHQKEHHILFKKYAGVKKIGAFQPDVSDDSNFTEKSVVLKDLQQKYQDDFSFKTQNELKHFDDTLQSDISRSDDDGNFSGFQTSKDDIGSDSPQIVNFPFKNETLINPETLNKSQILESKQNEKPNYATDAQKFASEEFSDVNLEILNVSKIDAAGFAEMEQKDVKEFKNQKVKKNSPDIEQIASNYNICDEEIIAEKREMPSDFSQHTEIESRSNVDVRYKPNEETIESPEVQKECSAKITCNTTTKGTARNECREFIKTDVKNVSSDSDNIDTNETQIASLELQKDTEEIRVEFENLRGELKYESENSKITCTETFTNSQNIHIVPKNRNEIKKTDILSKSTHTRLTLSNDSLSANDMSQIGQPATVSRETNSFSRTSSSSESENASEHGSYSSEPFSTSSSSSTPSNKSGNNLRVSIKRMPLPKSPSTSSQTSTSEELNKCSEFKRKPPMPKRSKKLQKKFVEKLSNENDDCFQRNQSDDTKIKQHFGENIKIENITLTACEINKTEICTKDESCSEENFEEYKSELVKKIVTEPIMQHTTQDSCESVVSEITDSISNESSNTLYLLPKQKNIKRKSLRNRKTGDDCVNLKEIDKRQSNDEQTPSEKGMEIKQVLYLSESDEYKQKNTCLENIEQKSTAIDGSENKQRDLSRSSELVKLQAQEQFKKPSIIEKEKTLQIEDKIKIIITDEEKTIQAENKVIDVVTNSTNIENKEKEVTELHNDDSTRKLSVVNEIITDTQVTETYESITHKIEFGKTSEVITDTIVTQKEKIPDKIHTDLDIKEKSRTEFSKQIDEEENTGEKTNLSRSYQITSGESNNNKEVDSINESKIQGEYLTEHEKEMCPREKIQLQTLENIQNETASPSQNLNKDAKSASIRNETNKELKFQEKKSDGDEGKIHFRQHFTKSPKGKCAQEEKICEIMDLGNAANTEGKTRASYEKSFTMDKEIRVEESENIMKRIIKEDIFTKEENIEEQNLKNTNLKECFAKPIEDKELEFEESEKDGKITLAREKIIKDIFTKEKNIQEQSLKNTNLKEYSAEAKKTEFIIERTLDKTLESTQGESETTDKKSAVIASQTENVTNTLTAKTRNNREDIYTREPSNQVEYSTQSFAKYEDSPENELNISVTTPESINYIELVSIDNELNDICKSNNEESLVSDVNSGYSLLKTTLKTSKTQRAKKKLKETDTKTTIQYKKSILTADEELPATNKNLAGLIDLIDKEETSPVDPKRHTAKKSTSSHILPSISNEASQHLTAELSSFKVESSLGINLADGNPMPVSSVKISPEVSIETIPSHPTMEINLSDRLEEINKPKDSLKVVMETSTSATHLENIVQKDKGQILVIKKAQTTHRGRKSRFKNLYGPEVDSEADSSNGKNTPVDEITDQKTKTSCKKQVMGNEIQSPTNFFETDIVACDVKRKPKENIREVSASLQESSQSNILSSQIKNVSIETNTLLDILRTVQSNTEAALKASKSPINTDVTNNENTIESTSKTQIEVAENVLKGQHESKTASPTELGILSPITVKKPNPSPERSDTASPLISKKITSSPTRSNSSSPLTLKKVTRRYERRSRRGEDYAHKTLEETFAEIAARSSKAVLAAKEHDDSEEQTTDENFQKELNYISTASDIEKGQFEEHLVELQKPSADGKRKATYDCEDPTHKPLEKVLTEITAQSSKAILPAKEYDVSEEQTTIEKSRKELYDFNTEANTEKEKVEDNLVVLQQSTSDYSRSTTYKKRSCSEDNSTIKTLEQTFSEIVSHSSEAALGTTNHVTYEEHKIDKKSQEELDNVTAELQKPTTEEKRKRMIDEKQSRHYEDSERKTSEEAFPESAAQSSNANLTAKGNAVNEGLTIYENPPPNNETENFVELQKSTTGERRKTTDDRRRRRGEDSPRKTLEETFAEIAALSSKAVLAAKEYQLSDEQTACAKSQKELGNINVGPNIEKEHCADIEKPTIDVEEMIVNTDSAPIVLKQDVRNPTENMGGFEITKVTPVKRGRKQKSRSFEVSLIATAEIPTEKNSPKVKKETNIIKELDKEIKNEKHIAEETENDYKTNKSVNETETSQPSKSSPASLTNLQVDSKESTNLLEILSKASLDVTESKSSKKSNKKRDTKAVIEDALVSNVDTCKDNECEIPNPKQPTKKRDSSLSKIETKLACKKSTQKTKNEEEDVLQKEEPLAKAAATTSPQSKRGRKPKNQQAETQQHTTISKKKTKKDKNDEEDTNADMVKLFESETETETETFSASLDTSFDEKLAKKNRQKKLKEAFEAALADDIEKCKATLETQISNPTDNTSFGLTIINNSPPPERNQSVFNEETDKIIKFTCITPVETEEDPDPLKDIEKFIADGVNLLKKDYKLDEDSVDDVIQTTPSKTTEMAEEPDTLCCEEAKPIFSTFETPADTPINTPGATPPPKSPTPVETSTPDENSGVRRSHRIKLITKTPKALVGRGLVRDKERFSIKDDVETKCHYTLDDHLTDLAEVEAKNAKFLKEMEERLSNFQVIKENEYLCERVISKEARKMICDCFLTHEEEERGELGCGEDCLNRLLMIECGPECNVKERCTNKRFQKLLCSPCRVFRTEKKGFGIMADIEILPGEFIMEYVGEVIDTEEFENRRIIYSQDKNRHYYFMALRSDAIIDATIKGNISRFINHSCDPNAETQKWTVNGELRIGFFSRKSIMPGEEITFNYQYQRYGREAQRCYCESTNCRGWIGQEPTSEEGEQMDYEDYESEDDEVEEGDTSNLLVQDDDEDSDTSVADPEEVQKQLEMAAAQAEVELAPLQLLEEKAKHGETVAGECKSMQDLNKSDNDEDSKSKFKKLLTKMAEKVAAKQKQNKREQKLQRKKKFKESSELTNKMKFLEDPDIEDEVEFLKVCGLKNQSDTLRLSRLMVRAKLVQTRLNLLEILRKGDFPCRRLFLDYHGLRLLHGWMSEDAGNMQIRLSLLQTLETLPIANKTVLTDSKVMQSVRNWCGNNTNLSPNDDSSSSNSNSQDVLVPGAATIEECSEMAELQKLALKLITIWEGLPEIFRIPKKERIEQMKEHEREADRQYAANAEIQENTTETDRYRRDRFGRRLKTPNNATNTSNRFVKPNSGNSHRAANAKPENIKNLSKAERREMFAAKVARDEAEKRLAEERREFETKCRFFGLDPKKTRTHDIPFCVNPATGQWYSIERKPINTPPSYAHVQVPVKPKSTNPNDYQLPAVCSTLTPQWKYAITPQGKIYYYHIKHRIPQWEPPSTTQLEQCDLEAREDSESELNTTTGEDSSDDDDDILIGMDAAQLKAYIDRKVELRRQKRYQRLVDERSISPRREEDRIYNQLEVRKYKENKEKIRKRKEDIRRKRVEVLRQTSLNMCTLGSVTDVNPNTSKLSTESAEELGSLPIQDYLLSSDEEVDLKAEVNSPLMDKIVEGDKIVDELDALTTKRQLKRPLPPHRDINEPPLTSSSSSASSSISNTIVAKPEYKKRKLEKKEKRKPKEQDAKYRKNKEKFRCEIAGIIVHHLKPYLKETCTLGRIQSNEDFNHLARKLTHFVMIKELKYCESVGQTLVVTESVKSKSREFIKKYMAKYGDVYVKPSNDPDFKNIPFTL